MTPEQEAAAEMKNPGVYALVIPRAAISITIDAFMRAAPESTFFNHAQLVACRGTARCFLATTTDIRRLCGLRIDKVFGLDRLDPRDQEWLLATTRAPADTEA